MIPFFLILFGVIIFAAGWRSATTKPSGSTSGHTASELEAWRILEQRFGMKRAREIMDVERWRYKEWNSDMKHMKWVFDTKTGEWNLQNK